MEPWERTDALDLADYRPKSAIETLIFPFALGAFNHWRDTMLLGPLLPNFIERARMITGITPPSFTPQLDKFLMEQLYIRIKKLIHRLESLMSYASGDYRRYIIDARVYPIMTSRQIQEITLDLLKKMADQIYEEHRKAAEMKRCTTMNKIIFNYFLKVTDESNAKFQEEFGELCNMYGVK